MVHSQVGRAIRHAGLRNIVCDSVAGKKALNGLRNRDLRARLYPAKASAKEERRRAARVSRLLALLRMHGILRKVTGTHRYHLTPKGRTVVTALLTAREADTEKLTQLAA